jgi:hypothetical protein
MARLLALFLLLIAAWPADARFVSTDPVEAHADSGAGFNRYAYANDNPYRFRDPDGRWAEDLFLGVPSVAFGAKSLYDNVRGGNYGAAFVDGLGIGADVAAILTPGVPGGAGLGIQASRAAGRLPNEALVVRGGDASPPKGGNSPEGIANGTGLHKGAGVVGFSVESAAGKTLCELCAPIRNNQVGVTNVGSIRAAGGDVIITPGQSPNHATVTGLAPEPASQLMQIQRNPAKAP